MWLELRAGGVPIVSSWIDEAGPGETENMSELWTRIHAEIDVSAAVVLYAEAGDFPLKGALIEAGIAIGLQKRVVVCLPGVRLDGGHRPIGSWITHPFVRREDDLLTACDLAIKGRAK